MKKNIRLLILALIAIVFSPSCTDNFEDYNYNREGVYNLPHDSYIKLLQQTVYFNLDYGQGIDWTFQLHQNLNADMFSGLLSSPNPFGSTSNLTYAMNDGWNSFGFNTANSYILRSAFKGHKSIAGDPNLAIYDAWIDILKVASMHRITDSYGPIIYTEFGKSNLGVPYDSQELIYTEFFKELENAITVLTKYESENAENTRFKNADLVYQGNMAKWIKYANTIRLRLAMTIVKVNPTLAKTQAEEAIKNKYGVLEDISDIARVSGMPHPLATISASWGDCVMSADIESILTGYSDKRLAKFFQPSKKPESPIHGKYKGVRLGVNQALKVYVGSSAANFTTATPVVIGTPAEAYLLRAEGALRGWAMGGTAKDLYEQGIKASFNQYEIVDNDYLSSKALPAKYEDLIIAENSHDAVNLVSPAWDESASNEVKLQKIITQKWIAVYPDGNIAWTDVRRTGYPKLFPVVNNLSQQVISTELGPRRLPFPSSEKLDNMTNYQDGVSKLGGPDNGATRVWWDVAKANF